MLITEDLQPRCSAPYYTEGGVVTILEYCRGCYQPSLPSNCPITGHYNSLSGRPYKTEQITTLDITGSQHYR